MQPKDGPGRSRDEFVSIVAPRDSELAEVGALDRDGREMPRIEGGRVLDDDALGSAVEEGDGAVQLGVVQTGVTREVRVSFGLSGKSLRIPREADAFPERPVRRHMAHPARDFRNVDCEIGVGDVLQYLE